MEAKHVQKYSNSKIYKNISKLAWPTCVYKQYEVKIKKVPEQWLQLFYWVITWKFLFSGGRGREVGEPLVEGNKNLVRGVYFGRWGPPPSTLSSCSGLARKSSCLRTRTSTHLKFVSVVLLLRILNITSVHLVFIWNILNNA